MLKSISSRLKFLAFIICIASAFAHAGTVDINHATAQELAASLIGIGIKKAEAIVEYRNRNGKFQAPEDITLVKGIGVKTFEKNKSLIFIQQGKESIAQSE